MSNQPTLNHEQVADWLRRNPDLLRQHPDLIELLELPDHPQAVSLVQHQVERLRRRSEQLELQLQNLAGIAGENERLMQRLHELTLDVMTAGSTGAFIGRLFERLAQDFSAEDVRLHLLQQHPDLVGLARVTIQDGKRPDWFSKLLDKGEPWCGRPTREKTGLLFPDAEAEIGSSALVPIAGIGLLAIGSTHEDRFHPGAGTLFLDLLGTTIGYRLKRLESGDRKRA